MFDSVRFDGVSFRYVIPAWRSECNWRATGCWSTEKVQNESKEVPEQSCQHNSLAEEMSDALSMTNARVFGRRRASFLLAFHSHRGLKVLGERVGSGALVSSDYLNVRSTGWWCIHRIEHQPLRLARITPRCGWPQIFANNCFVFSIPGNLFRHSMEWTIKSRRRSGLWFCTDYWDHWVCWKYIIEPSYNYIGQMRSL